ncbi:alkaline phosphatase family protein [Microbacterium karelineae]|uniref:alkaline phosphatase family protein n=1 Tax=Microbacterium karelineae TaxID=2654283 RepID=UPI0012EA50CD|nr:nucleotide pyrophosphatase/phosphodiesterase family protein [Microbacterium karelineae]
MQKILPAGPATARNLAGVATEIIRSLRGGGQWLPPAASGVAVLVDGLGAIQLRAHQAHARRLAQAMPRKHVAQTVFPSTTAAALASFLTGEHPGRHGLVGYRTLDPARDVLTNQLNGYERDGLDPAAWQRSETVFERAAAEGVAGYAVGAASYRSTGLTAALMRGAEYVAEDDIDQRVRVACALAAQQEGAFVYCYIPELDQAGHRHGVDSDEWRGVLETIDRATAPALEPPRGVGTVVTADHGMIDVPRSRHVLLAEGDPRLDGVRHLGGEPRMLHVYAEPGEDVGALAERWRSLCERTADVSTRAEAIADGLFGEEIAAHVEGRIGDVLVAARGIWAFYDDRLADKGAQRMIGQHGSITPEETTVPLIRRGAYAG